MKVNKKRLEQNDPSPGGTKRNKIEDFAES